MCTKRTAFLRGFATRLFVLERDRDKPTAAHWINDQQLTQYMVTRLPKTVDEEGQWIENVNTNKRHAFSLGIEAPDGEFIGIMTLCKIDYLNGTAETASMIGRHEYQGYGYGTDARLALLWYAFNMLNLRKITSSVIACNARSEKSLVRCGYEVEGRLHNQIVRFGQIYDMKLLAVYREQFERAYEHHMHTVQCETAQ